MNVSIPLAIAPFTLRELRYTDIHALHQLYHSPEVSKWLPKGFTSGSVISTAWLLKELLSQAQFPKGLMLAIVDANDSLIGTCALEAFVRDHARYEIAFELHPNYHRQGIMQHALLELIRIAFQDFKANRLDAYTLTYNIASQKLLQKVGFNREGVLKNFRYFRDAYHDIVILGLTRDDWLSG